MNNDKNNSQSGSVSSENVDPTIAKAKSEINAQTDSMIKEIELRRKRRQARQREIEQQLKAEEEAKARRAALRSSESAKSIPAVSSADSVFSNKHRLSSDAQTSNLIDNLGTKPPSSRAEASSKRSTKNAPKRQSIPAGETQRIPKVTAEPTKPTPASSKPVTRRSTDTVSSGEKTTSSGVKRRPASSSSSYSSASASSGVRRRDSGSERSSIPASSRNDVQASTNAAVSSAISAGSSKKPESSSAYISSNAAASAKSANSRKKPKKKKATNTMKEIRDWVISIAIAVAIALLLRSFVFTLVKVQGESMVPTLHQDERLYVNRLFYSPQKGDVIIFKPASDPDRPYVKRVIATEGDTVYIDFSTGDVYVNDKVIDEPYINEKTARTGSYINELIANGQYSKENPIVIEKDKVFVMGDNRNNSKDSREIGQVPEDEIIGGAVFRFWPLNKFGGVSYDYETSYLIEDENNNFFIA